MTRILPKPRTNHLPLNPYKEENGKFFRRRSPLRSRDRQNGTRGTDNGINFTSHLTFPKFFVRPGHQRVSLVSLSTMFPVPVVVVILWVGLWGLVYRLPNNGDTIYELCLGIFGIFGTSSIGDVFSLSSFLFSFCCNSTDRR